MNMPVMKEDMGAMESQRKKFHPTLRRRECFPRARDS